MEVIKSKLDGVLVIKPPTNFEDFRGNYVEIYNERIYKDAGIHYDFVQDDISVSSKHVLRGIHGDATTAKLISCLYGRFYFMVSTGMKHRPNMVNGRPLPCPTRTVCKCSFHRNLATGIW